MMSDRPDYPAELEELARRLADAMVYENQRGRNIARALDETLGAEDRPDFSDLEAHVDQLQDAARLYDTAFPDEANKILAVQGRRQPIPVDPFSFFIYNVPGAADHNPRALANVDWLNFVRERLPQTLSSMGWETLRLTLDQSLESVAAHFRNILLARMASRSQAGPPSGSPGGLLPFTVHTRLPGFRVRYSPAYLLTTGAVFGSPTTPVKGWLRPGTYVFGVEGQYYSLRWDTGEFDVPPAKDATLTVI